MGLAIPLSSFWFTLDGVTSPRVDCEPDQDADPGSWQFHSAEEGDTHHLAVALRTSGVPFEVKITAVVP